MGHCDYADQANKTKHELRPRTHLLLHKSKEKFYRDGLLIRSKDDARGSSTKLKGLLSSDGWFEGSERKRRTDRLGSIDLRPLGPDNLFMSNARGYPPYPPRGGRATTTGEICYTIYIRLPGKVKARTPTPRKRKEGSTKEGRSVKSTLLVGQPEGCWTSPKMKVRRRSKGRILEEEEEDDEEERRGKEGGRRATGRIVERIVERSS
uniref:Uncharacterized protein n=1 Tax=Vespula pensylvanica TaxID=30213 RepID=A0A834PFK1_VESPE|nr:hypothetical protein H0235_001121 [Vespula pensylvanica]